SDTAGSSLMLSFIPHLTHPPSCLPSLGTGCTPCTSRVRASQALSRVYTPVPAAIRLRIACSWPASPPSRYYEGSDSCHCHHNGRSPRLARTYFPTFRLQPRGWPEDRFIRHSSV